MTLGHSRALAALTAWAALCAPAWAQDGTDPDQAEIDRLRLAAEEELLDDDDRQLSEADRLRRYAEVEAEETDVLYQQLLNSWSAFANRLNNLNPRITVFGDTLARLSASSAEEVEDGRNLDDRITLREVELDLRADIDPYAKGVLIIAAEEEGGGEYEFTIEEGYLTLETLPLGFRSQIGRFRVPFGRMNPLHTHDLPQSTRPYMLTDLFGEEGFVENGALVSWLAPWIPLTLTGGILNGENEGVFAGGDSDDPAWLVRAEQFVSLTDTLFLTAGGTFMFGYNDAPTPAGASGAPKQETQLYGADVLIKYQPSQFFSIVAQGELYNMRKEVAGGREHAFGGYALLQVQPLQRWYFGLRYDYSDYFEGVEDSNQWALGAYVSFYTTEFLRFRIGYEHRERPSTNGGEGDLDTVFFQLTFVFGSHPVEPFWFNR